MKKDTWHISNFFFKKANESGYIKAFITQYHATYDTIIKNNRRRDHSMKHDLIKRLTTYAKMDTQSNEKNDSTPSTPGQMELAHILVDELKSIGMDDVGVDDNGNVMATLPANNNKKFPTIGFLFYVNTATDFNGKNFPPQVVENYDGNDIALNEEVTLSTDDFPELSQYKGHTLITTDGTTLLGADN